MRFLSAGKIIGGKGAIAAALTVALLAGVAPADEPPDPAEAFGPTRFGRWATS